MALISWICGFCHTYNLYEAAGDNCSKCGSDRHNQGRSAPGTIGPAECAKILTNPRTGETRVEGRTDRPIHPKYRAAGFTERRELTTLPAVRRFEKDKGLAHEASN